MTSNGGTQVFCSGANINPVAVAFLQFKNPDGNLLRSGFGLRNILDRYLQRSGQVRGTPSHRQPRLCDQQQEHVVEPVVLHGRANNL